MLNNLSITEVLLFSVFMLSLIVQLGYYWGVFSHFSFYKKQTTVNDQKPISIVICARNESANLKKNMYSILEQSYPEFEVIVINDCSWDDSGLFLEELEKQYKHLKVLTIQEQEKYQHGKKFALTLGIKASRYDILLMIDADCIVQNKNWASIMQNNFNNNTDIVLGYGGYRKKGGLLNRVIRFDTFYTALQYLSFSLMGMTYMGVGRNLAYKKSVFFKNKGFASHQHILSGDDDLFVNEVATKTNVKVEVDPQSFTSSEPETLWRNWFRQKHRHFSTGKYYKVKHKLTLGILSVSHFFFYVSLIALLVLQFEWRLVLILFLVRLISQLIIFGKAMKRLDEWDIWLLSPIFDLFGFIFYPVLSVSNLFIKVNKWK